MDISLRGRFGGATAVIDYLLTPRFDNFFFADIQRLFDSDT